VSYDFLVKKIMNSRRSAALFVLIASCLPLVTGACGVPVAASVASTAADGASYAATNKTTFDHFTSMVTRKDCSTLRVLDNEKICRDREDGHDPYSVSYSDPFRSAGEGGVEYSPPLEPATNVPAVSWDAAAYQAPAPAAPDTPPATTPFTVSPATLASTPAAPAPAAAPATHTKKKKSSAHAPRKSGQGQVASRS
jgi:hypothetical protein